MPKDPELVITAEVVKYDDNGKPIPGGSKIKTVIPLTKKIAVKVFSQLNAEDSFLEITATDI